MGNAALLCAPSLIISNGGGGVRVISSTDGRLTIYKNTNAAATKSAAPLKAAEIMQQNPGQFLCESSHLRVGHRIAGLCEDEEMEIGQLYFLLPIEMLYSVLTEDEMSSLFSRKIAPNKGFKQAATVLHNFSKKNISFPHEYFCLFHNNNINNDNSNNNSEQDSATGEKFTRQRSWEPALETIDETSPIT